MFEPQRLSHLPLGLLATRLPGAAGVLRRSGVAAGDAPDSSLAEAAAGAGTPLAPLLGTLDGLAAAAAARRVEGATTAQLIDRALSDHAGLRAGLATLRRLTAEPGALEAADPGLAPLVEALSRALEEHMLKEELRVFPMWRGGSFERMAEWIALLRGEHDDAAPFLWRIEEITGGFRPPRGAAPAAVAFHAALERVIEDLVAHLYLEEAMLYPRLQAEARLPQRS